MKKAKKKRDQRTISFAGTLEMLFSLMLIPTGLAAVEGFDEEAIMEQMSVPLMLALLMLALATFLRAMAGRYKYQVAQRRLWDFIFSAAFLVSTLAILFKPESVMICVGAGVVFLLSLIPSRVLAIIRERKWYKVLLNAIVALVALFYAICIWEADREIQLFFCPLIMMLIAVRGFIRVMAVIFARLRLDVLRDIIRKTYAAEIIFGLVLLIVAFSWVLMYMDPGINRFTDALWYCFAVVTTIGFGDLTAGSAIGRVLTVILGIYGIIVVALITSIIVNFYGEMKKAGIDDNSEESDAGEEKETQEET